MEIQTEGLVFSKVNPSRKEGRSHQTTSFQPKKAQSEKATGFDRKDDPCIENHKNHRMPAGIGYRGLRLQRIIVPIELSARNPHMVRSQLQRRELLADQTEGTSMENIARMALVTIILTNINSMLWHSI
jgi:hypothetical protein